MEIVNYISRHSEQEKEINNDEEGCSMRLGVNQHNRLYNPILQELRDQEKHIEQLRGAVRAKGQPLKVAQVHTLFCVIVNFLLFNSRSHMGINQSLLVRRSINYHF